MSNKLKLALVAAEFLPNWGGAGTYNVRLVKYLKDDLDIHVITPRRIIANSKVTYTGEQLANLFDNKVHFHFITAASDTFLYNAKFQWAVARALPALQRRYHFDLIHTDHPHMSDILLKSVSGIPRVTTVHTTIREHLNGIRKSKLGFSQVESSEKFQLILNYPLLLTEKFYLKRRKNIITVSDWMKNELEHNYAKDRIDVVYSGVEPEVFQTGEISSNGILTGIKEPVVLFSSRMTAAKGGYFLIKAMRQVLDETDRVHFAFAGSELTQPWKSLLDEQRIKPEYYTFLGYLPYEQLAAMYRRATIYLCPSLCENLPARLLEAMSCGKPVITTGIYGIPEAVTDGVNGRLIPPGDAEALSRAVLDLLDDPDQRERLGSNARRTVLEKFDWRKLAPQIKAVYDRVVGSHGV